MFVKICGIQEAAHAQAAVEAGADAIGFLFSDSPRQVGPDLARDLVSAIPDQVLTVGVFAGVAPEDIRRIATEANVDAVQLHGSYEFSDFSQLKSDPFTIIRAVAGSATTVLDTGAWGEDMLIVDSATPGAGHAWDWDRLPTPPTGQWMLAGGLRPDTVASAVSALNPWGVDVSSGVEVRRGVKDSALIREFVAAAKSAA